MNAIIWLGLVTGAARFAIGLLTSIPHSGYRTAAASARSLRLRVAIEYPWRTQKGGVAPFGVGLIYPGTPYVRLILSR